MAELIAGPIMKWAGGKTQMLDDIKQRMPKKFNKYIEPFFGGGALFFNLILGEEWPLSKKRYMARRLSTTW